LFFNNLGLCHIESSVSQLSPFSLYFYPFAGVDPILGLRGHHADTKVDTNTATATTGLSLSDESVLVSKLRS